MQLLQIASENDYADYLKEHPNEFEHFFINFTSFFRDISIWEYIAKEILPRIIAGKPESEPLKIWSAGCASGEETYTLSIILAEAIGVEQFRSRVRIYSSDVDEDALKEARQGSYVSNEVVGIPDGLLEKYFERVGDRYVFRQDLRRSIIFCRHNVIEDAPMSKINLLTCRNVLMYFNTEAQMRALVRFYFGLKDSGFLLLGNTETIPTALSNLFTPINLHHHIFMKLPRVNLNPLLLIKALSRQHREGR